MLEGQPDPRRSSWQFRAQMNIVLWAICGAAAVVSVATINQIIIGVVVIAASGLLLPMLTGGTSALAIRFFVQRSNRLLHERLELESSIRQNLELEVKKRTQELVQHRDHLEELVGERTAELQEKALQLEQALKGEKELAALQRKFISLVSHEFRTPLTIIDGMAQRLVRSKRTITPEILRERSDKIRSAVERMTDLIENTLYAARLEEGVIEMNPAAMGLGGMLHDLGILHGDISPYHDIVVDVDGLPQSISADEKLLDIVFTNLLSNAVKFAPDAPSIKVKGWTEGEHAVVSISDRGVGIAEDELPYMFGRFFRARTAEGIKGTGIGLSVSKEFVKMHDGTIEVASVEGEGSTFTVRLPINVKDQ